MASDAELAAMRRAVSLSAQALGTTNPNPSVGAVVLDRAGGVAGEGVTQPVGGDHAEVGALRAAADRARGGTIVVTLEPCRHVGRTPSCAAAIASAGVARVVFALPDPHATAAGGGEELRANGIEVEAGVLADDAAAVLQPWLVAAGRHRPYVTWKYAATLDGRTAAADGSSKWITGDLARLDVHRERSRADAVVAGIGTVLADDAHLAVRDWPASRQPLRVVVDGDARTPHSARVLDDAAPTLIVVGEDADAASVVALQSQQVEVVRLPRPNGLVDLPALLTALYEREVFIVLLEGGATLAASFIRAGLVDRVIGYHAPLLLGDGTPVLGDAGIATLADGVRLDVSEVAKIGNDIRIVAQIRTGSA